MLVFVCRICTFFIDAFFSDHLLGAKFFFYNRFLNKLLNNRLSEFFSDYRFLSSLMHNRGFVFLFYNLRLGFVKNRFMQFMDHLLVLFMDHRLINFSYFFLVDNRLMIFMDNILMVLMNNVLMMFMNYILVMFMNYISMKLFYNWLIYMSLNNGCCSMLLDYSLRLLSIDNRLILGSNYSWFLIIALLNNGLCRSNNLCLRDSMTHHKILMLHAKLVGATFIAGVHI